MELDFSQFTRKLPDLLKNRVVLFVTSDDMRVVLEVLDCNKEILKNRNFITYEDIVSYIEKNKIKAPINEKAVHEAINTQKDLTPRSYVITKEKNISFGKPREVKIFLSDKPSVAPSLAGTSNSQEERISNLKRVKKGELIGEEIPPVLPQYGTNVFGIPIPAPKLKDDAPMPDQNVIRKNNKFYSAIDGVLLLSNYKKINVLPVQILERNLNNLSKTISSKGVIIINGAVNKCSFIECAVLVCKNITLTKVKTTNDVIVLEKISDSKIDCGGSIYVGEISVSDITTKEDVLVIKSIVKSDITSDGKVVCRQKGIYSSIIKARYYVDTRNMGSPNGELNEVTVGSGSQSGDKINLIQEKIEERETIRADAENRLRLEHARLRGRFPHEEIDQHIQLVPLNKEITLLINEIKVLEKKKNVLLKNFSKTRHMVYMRVRGVAAPGNVIKGINSSILIKTPLKAFQVMETLMKNTKKPDALPKYTMSILHPKSNKQEKSPSSPDLLSSN